ncbi:MAG: hypothetical protein JOZ47_15490 [Kutzneria sp.]|nr:hypothetical protein [Kutzneria sp.]MBV9846455.1 hypothetical protein [Kutzneria sp.]
MASMEELEARVTALEDKVRLVREDAAAARVLAGGADRDVSAFAARLDTHHALLSTLRETQVEQGRMLDEQGRRLDEQGREMRAGFSMLATGQAEITVLLGRLSGKGQGDS